MVVHVCVCVHRLSQQQAAGGDIPECVCSNSAVWVGGGGGVPAAASDQRKVSRGRF